MKVTRVLPPPTEYTLSITEIKRSDYSLFLRALLVAANPNTPNLSQWEKDAINKLRDELLWAAMEDAGVFDT